MTRRFTNQRNLVKPGKTRFATTFLTLQSMFKQKSNLRTMFISEKWNNSKFANEVLGKESCTDNAFIPLLDQCCLCS
ncbi:hypothetical protein T459_19821 [Capsicum annuum]|uniref:Uncharacterized protein n=1 Tax=Capsicum annuum TaxID=4072 RepID=A0A2G2Z2U5_CAPAN|nr:hypothetical protein T459_19821 [Capsicum annuum]